MKEIKKSASLKSKVKGKQTPFNIDLNYSPEYDSFIIKVKKGEGFMSYTDTLQGLPLDVVKKLNNMLEEVLVQADSEYNTKKFDDDYADIGQFSLPDSQWNKTEQEYIKLGKEVVKTKFKGDLEKAYDYVVRKKREFGGDFQAGVYKAGGSIKESDIKVGEKFKLVNGEVIEIKRLFTENMDENWVEYTRNGKTHENSVNALKIFINNWREGKTKYAMGGSLQAHGIEVGDTFLGTLSGNIQKVKDRSGKVVYINLENGDRSMERPLPFDEGGEVKYYINKDGIKVRSKVEPKGKLSEAEWMAKHNTSREARTYATGGGVGLIGNQKRIDMNKNGKIDAEDFKLLRSSMNGAWRNERKHVNHNEDYEVRYARKKPSRTGYKGKRKFGEGGALNLDFKNFTLDELINNLPQDVDFMWINKANTKDYVRRYSAEFKKYSNKKFTITDSGKMELSKGSENMYLDIMVFESSYEAPETEYIISIYTKDNQKGLKEFTNNLIQKFAGGGGINKTIEINSEITKIIEEIKSKGKYEKGKESVNSNGVKYRYDFYKLENPSIYLIKKIDSIQFKNYGQRTLSNSFDYRKIELPNNKDITIDRPNYKGQTSKFVTYRELVILNEDGGGVEEKYVYKTNNRIFADDLLKYADLQNIEASSKKVGSYYYVTTNKKIEARGSMTKELAKIVEGKKFKEGGGISNFERLSRIVAKNYEGKKVKPKYQKEYGKVYSKSEAKEVGNKVAGKIKAMQKAESGAEVKKGNKGGIMVLAKKIRKEGESWKDALKRAGQQLK